jgi:hypothetical protein
MTDFGHKKASQLHQGRLPEDRQLLEEALVTDTGPSMTGNLQESMRE